MPEPPPRLSRRAALGRLALGGTLALAALAGCEPAAPTNPRAQARRALADARTPRVVALSPALAITLRDMGLEGTIVGRHAWDFILDPALPICGDQTGIDYEALLTVEPTHVLIEWGSRELPPRLVELAARHEWTLRSFRLLTLDDIEAAAADLYDMLRTQRGDPRPFAATDLALAMQEAWSRAETDLAPAGRVLLLGAIDPPAALGPGSFHDQLLRRLGATPAIDAARGSPWMVLDLEDVRAIAPDAIILFRPRPMGKPAPPPPAPAALISAMGRLGQMPVPAITSGRVALIDHPLGLTPSTALIDISHELRRLLEPWAAQPITNPPPPL